MIEMDATPVDEASKVLHPVARAEVSMRMASGSDGEQQLAALMDHLKGAVPHGAHVTVERIEVGQPFRARTDGPSHTAARGAQNEAFGRESQFVGSGGSVPLLDTLQRVVAGAEFILWGAQDTERARIHGADESEGGDRPRYRVMTRQVAARRADRAERRAVGVGARQRSRRLVAEPSHQRKPETKQGRAEPWSPPSPSA